MNASRLGDILLARHWVAQEDLDRAIDRQRQDPRPLGQILLDQTSISERQLTRALRWQRLARAAVIMGSLGAGAVPAGASEALRLTDQMVERIAKQYAKSPAKKSGNMSTDDSAQRLKSLLGAPAWTLLQGRYTLGDAPDIEGVRYQARWSSSHIKLEIRYQF